MLKNADKKKNKFNLYTIFFTKGNLCENNFESL